MLKYIILAIVIKAVLVISSLTSQDVFLQIKAPSQVEAGSTVDVEIELNKANVTGFARFRQKLPHGVTASPVYPAEMSFSHEDNTVKMIWLNLPGQEKITLRYQIHIHERLTGDIHLDGIFSYIDNNQRNSVKASGTLLAVSPSPDVEERLIVDISETDETMFPSPSSADHAVEISSPLEAESGVYYRVQLAAGHRPVDIESYFGKLDITDDVHAEIHEGWFKYSIGSYYNYREARDYRVHIWNTTPIDDAFVAAYNEGVRITVQEALMIANHQWYR